MSSLLKNNDIQFVVLDLDQFDYFNSSVIGYLMMMHNEFVEAGKNFIFTQANEHIFDIIKSIDETFRNADVINGYIVVIQWASRSFLSESPRHQNHTLMYICDKAFVKQLINYDITEQEFLDKVIILGKTGLRGENRTNIQLN